MKQWQKYYKIKIRIRAEPPYLCSSNSYYRKINGRGSYKSETKGPKIPVRVR
jgi:hypothetical protein